jgi:hypothetical protein
MSQENVSSVEGVYRGHGGIRRWWVSTHDAFAELRNRGRGAAGGTPVEQETESQALEAARAGE